MAILKLQLDKPVSAVLKFAKGKFYESKFPGAEGQLMFTLESGECVFLPETADETFSSKNVGAGDPFVMCLRKTRGGARFLEVQKLSDAVEMPEETEEAYVKQLRASVAQAQRGASPVKVSPASAPATVATSKEQSPLPNGIAVVPSPAARPGSLMTAALCASVDSVQIAMRYAASLGLTLPPPSFEDVRAIAATLYIQRSKENPGARAGVR